MAKSDQDGLDILRFFIGVMALLTVFVAGFAAVKFAEAESLREEVEQAENDYANVQRIGQRKTFLEAVAREASMQEQIDPEKQDLAQYLQEVARKINLTLERFRPEGGGSTGPGRRYLKKSIRFNIELQPLEVIVDYLWYLQATWPGLKVEELSLKPQKTREGAFQGWNAQVLVTTFKAKPAGQR
jgi:hypothetical protein